MLSYTHTHKGEGEGEGEVLLVGNKRECLLCVSSPGSDAMPKKSVACIVTRTTAYGTYRLEDTESRHDTIFKINHTDRQLIYPSTGFLIQLKEGEHRHRKKKKTMGHLTSPSTKYFTALHG
jgi:hypothetical protein